MKYTPRKWRFLRALALTGHPRIRARAAWLFIIPQFALYLYLLGPVFVYYTRGVPPEESLEVITGTWRIAGKLSAGRNRLYPPRYVIDTETGPRDIHCGLWTQKSFCGQFFLPRLATGDKVWVRFDPYFGILAYGYLTPPFPNAKGLAYRDGVTLYAQAKHTIRFNKNAHFLFPLVLAIYVTIAALCWRALGQDLRPTPWSVE